MASLGTLSKLRCFKTVSLISTSDYVLATSILSPWCLLSGEAASTWFDPITATNNIYDQLTRAQSTQDDPKIHAVKDDDTIQKSEDLYKQ